VGAVIEEVAMLFEITHKTTFTYEPAVFLEPITVRLRPRCDCTQELLQHALTLTPDPTGACENVDLDGNGVHTFWFEGMHTFLEIVAVSRVETLRANPFDFLMTDPAALTLPASYPSELEPSLKPYRERVRVASEVDDFARDLQKQSEIATLSFLSLLGSKISTLCDHVVREHGEPMLPNETLAASQSTCRDLAVLAMDVCRSVGLATRFVSGYQQCDTAQVIPHLHAWYEVYLLGAGWRGYDPTNGVAIGDHHVALQAAANPRQAAPTGGTFRGTGAQSGLKYRLSIKTKSEAS
jgi:transglutaminase-like putative cysteine protease